MAKHEIWVTQVLRVERHTVVEVEADSADDAIEAVSNGDGDLPDDSRWEIDREELESEICELMP